MIDRSLVWYLASIARCPSGHQGAKLSLFGSLSSGAHRLRHEAIYALTDSFPGPLATTELRRERPHQQDRNLGQERSTFVKRWMPLTPSPVPMGMVLIRHTLHLRCPDWSVSCRSASAQRCTEYQCCKPTIRPRPPRRGVFHRHKRNGWPMFQPPSADITSTKNL